MGGGGGGGIFKIKLAAESRYSYNEKMVCNAYMNFLNNNTGIHKKK